MKRSVNKTKSSRVSQELLYYSTGFDFKICLRTRKVTGPFEKRAPDLDKLSSRLIRECADLISPYIPIVFNCCLTTGTFTNDWKLAKVVPIFKQGDRSDMNNYRPISVISAIAKVFERIVYNQLSSYLSENNILSKYQSGFRSFHSTVTALLEATDNWAFNIDRGYVNASVFLDLKKHLTQSITLFHYPNYIHMESKELPTNCFLLTQEIVRKNVLSMVSFLKAAL